MSLQAEQMSSLFYSHTYYSLILMYFELTIDILTDFGINRPDDLPASLCLINGSTINDPIDNPFVFQTKAAKGDIPPDFWGNSFPAMSGRFIALLEEAGVNNLQKFPAVVKSEIDGTVWDDYFLVNILDSIQCADLSKSIYTEIFPGNYDFEDLAIDSEKIKDTLLFRLEESPSKIIIHKSVGKYIMENDPDEIIKGWDVK